MPTAYHSTYFFDIFSGDHSVVISIRWFGFSTAHCNLRGQAFSVGVSDESKVVMIGVRLEEEEVQLSLMPPSNQSISVWIRQGTMSNQHWQQAFVASTSEDFRLEYCK